MTALRLFLFGLGLLGLSPIFYAAANLEPALDAGSASRLHLKWKLRLPSRPRELTNLATPVIAPDVHAAGGVHTLIAVAGASGTLDVVEASSGKLLWHREFADAAQPADKPSWICPNALNAAPVIEFRDAAPLVHVLTADGRLHSVQLDSGEEASPPIPFVPAFAKAWSLVLENGVIYTTTSQGCGGAKSGVYSLDLKDPAHPVHFFAAAPMGAGIWGSAGVAVANGTVFAEAGDGEFDPDRKSYASSVLALRAGTLELQDYFAPANWEMLDRMDLDMGSISPLVFPFNGGQLVAAAGKEGRIFLLDAKSLGGSRHQTPLFETPVLVNSEQSSAGRGFWGAFASWEDAQHVRYLFAPAWGELSSPASAAVTHGSVTHGSILAYRVEDRSGTPVLTPAWVSRDLEVPAPPLAANGLVFAVSSGEQSMQADKAGRQYNSADRIRTAPGHAVLYALDAATGKQLFSSGNAMRSFTHMHGLALSGGQIYVATFDSMLYCFGL